MIHGKVKAELTNTLTKKKRVYEVENTVTNALLRYSQLEENPTFNNKIFPLYKNGLGALLLFSGTLTESANNMLSPRHNAILGTAGQSTEPIYTQPVFGELVENRIISSKQVVSKWVFPAGVATGTVSALARTHESSVYMPYCNKKAILSSNLLPLSGDRLGSIAYYDAATQYLYGLYFVWDDDFGGYTSITVKRVKISLPPYSDVTSGYTAISSGTTYEVVTNYTIQHPSLFINKCGFYNPDDGYIYVTVGVEDTEGALAMRYIKINPSTWAFEEKTVALPAGTTAGTDSYHFIYGGNAYYRNGNVLHSVNIETDEHTTCTYSNGQIFFTACGGVIVTGQGDDVAAYYSDGDLSNLTLTADSGYKGSFDYPIDSARRYFARFANPTAIDYQLYCDRGYLGTVLNLPTPIEKTNLDELTIEYTLTVED